KDYYTQPGDLYRLVSEEVKNQIASNVAESMEGVPQDIVIRGIARFYQADKRCGTDIAAKMGVDLAKVETEVKNQKG
ncbi:MAG: catalase, partial [Bacteroidales bacterium]|nr:catalase [Bacteroidales bacterium]